MGKYDAWDSFFAQMEESEVVLRFDQLEAVIGFKLPRSAYTYPTWWRSTRHAAWRYHNWRAFPDLRHRTVRFVKNGELGSGKIEEHDESTVSKVLSSNRRLILLGALPAQHPRPSQARDLYRSPLWERRRAYAEATGEPWRIMSPEYGIVLPETVIEPYGNTLQEEGAVFRRLWSQEVARDVVEACAVEGVTVVECHANNNQLRNGVVSALNAAGLTVSWPLRGRSAGEQLVWYGLAIGAFRAVPRDAIGYPIRSASSSVETAEELASGDALIADALELNAETETPRSAISALGRSVGTPVAFWKDRARRWADALAVNWSVETERKWGRREPPPMTLHARLRLAESIALFGKKRSEIIKALTGPSWTGDPEVDARITGNSFVFLTGIILDQGTTSDGVWGRTLLLLDRLGNLDPESIVADPDAVTRAIEGPPSLHQSAAKASGWMISAAHRVIGEYQGDAYAIWPPGSSREEVREALETFDGIGPRQSAHAADLLERYVGVEFRLSPRDSLAYDPDLRRVMIRTGLAEHDDIAHMTESIAEMFPEAPGSLDKALMTIGQRWCHPRNPSCDKCAIGDECPRLVRPSRGRVRGSSAGELEPQDT